VVKLDRVGRSVRNLIDVAAELDAKHVDLVVLDQGIDTTTAAGKLLFHVMAAIAEFERELVRERTRDGLAATKARGRSGGRKPRLTAEQKAQAVKFRAGGCSIAEIGVMLGNGHPVSKATVCRALGMTSDSDKYAPRAGE
jgi:DNA invertase Pin-like site-specific DNA recombinase